MNYMFIFSERREYIGQIPGLYSEEEIQFIFSSSIRNNPEKMYELMIGLHDALEFNKFVSMFELSLKISFAALISTELPTSFFMPGIFWPKSEGWFFTINEIAVILDLPTPEYPEDYLAIYSRCLTVNDDSSLISLYSHRIANTLRQLGLGIDAVEYAGFEYKPLSREYRDLIASLF